MGAGRCSRVQGRITAMNMLFQKNTSELQVTSDAETDVFSPGVRWLFVGLIFLLVVLVRVRLLEIPLERDEGEYAYMGQLLLEGVPPYSEANNMKFPGTYVMYAGMMALFGQTVRGIHVGLMALNCATILFIYFLGKKIANDLSAIIASGSYALLSLNSSVLGSAAHATHFVVLSAVSGSYVLLNAVEKNRRLYYVLSLGMFGLALLMKQPGAFFIAFGASYIILQYFSGQPMKFSREAVLNLALFLSAALLPLLAASIWFFFAGVFNKFWFWTVQYAAVYGSQVSISKAFDYFRETLFEVVDGYSLLWIISGLGFLLTLFHRDRKERRRFIVLLSLMSFLSVCPGFLLSPTLLYNAAPRNFAVCRDLYQSSSDNEPRLCQIVMATLRRTRHLCRGRTDRRGWPKRVSDSG
jgi:4-amino-4-deoxy-L-arabinose transferase-like glycosyltransferase